MSKSERPTVYLAGPYTDPDEGVRDVRAKCLSRAAAILMGEGLAVMSPVSHGHAIWEHGKDLAFDHAAWKPINDVLQDASDYMLVLKMPGWEKSDGVTSDRDRWNGDDPSWVPIFQCSPDDESIRRAARHILYCHEREGEL